MVNVAFWADISMLAMLPHLHDYADHHYDTIRTTNTFGTVRSVPCVGADRNLSPHRTVNAPAPIGPTRSSVGWSEFRNAEISLYLHVKGGAVANLPCHRRPVGSVIPAGTLDARRPPPHSTAPAPPGGATGRRCRPALNSVPSSVTLPDVRAPLVLFTDVLFAGTLLSGCTGPTAAPHAFPEATAPPPYVLVSRPVRDFEIPLRPVATSVGKLRITPIGLRTGMCCVVGTHAEWPADGQYVSVRVQIQNTDRDRQEFDTAGQFLITADDRVHKVNANAMNIKRQDFKISMGAGNVLEMDLFYDVPKDASIKAIRLTGKNTTSIGGIETGALRMDVPLPPTSR